MKTFIVFGCLIMGISAAVLPGSKFQPAALRSERIISDTIISIIEEISQDIKDAGYDPLNIEKEDFGYQLPVPVIFNAAAIIEQVFSTGISNIIVNNMSYSIILSRLTFDIQLPHILLSAGGASGQVTVFGETLDAVGDGRVEIRGIRVVGEVRVNIGIISGISISRVTINLSIGSITTNIRLAIAGQNYSEAANQIISKIIPETLNEFSAEVNELIEIILLDAINDMLQQL